MIKTRLKKCPICHSDVKVIVDWDGGRINGKFRQFGYCSICGYHADPKHSYEEAALAWKLLTHGTLRYPAAISFHCSRR